MLVARYGECIYNFTTLHWIYIPRPCPAGLNFFNGSPKNFFMSIKNNTIILRVSKDEKELISKKANYIGITISEYIRQLFIYGDVKNVPEDVVVDLRRIGINVNQIAKRVNGGSIGSNELLIELEKLISELKKINLR